MTLSLEAEFPRKVIDRADGWAGPNLDDAALERIELDPSALPYPHDISRIEDDGGSTRARERPFAQCGLQCRFG